MKPKLSIVIPCYNCQETLEEAVNSRFVQGLSDSEIVMVNGTSLDNTKDVVLKLVEKYAEIMKYTKFDAMHTDYWIAKIKNIKG